MLYAYQLIAIVISSSAWDPAEYTSGSVFLFGSIRKTELVGPLEWPLEKERLGRQDDREVQCKSIDIKEISFWNQTTNLELHSEILMDNDCHLFYD